MSLYPPPFSDETGGDCKGDRGEFDFPFGTDSSRDSRIEFARKFVYEPLTEMLNGLSGRVGWTIVGSHTKSFLRHGVCAVADPSNPAEALSIPYLYRVENGKRIWHFNVWKDRSSREFPLDEYRGYARRQRWFRLPVDAKLNIAQNTGLFKIRKNISLLDETAGIFHPTAEGHAEMADAFIRSILSIGATPK